MPVPYLNLSSSMRRQTVRFVRRKVKGVCPKTVGLKRAA